MKKIAWIALALFAVAAASATCAYRPIEPRPPAEISEWTREAPKPAIALAPKPESRPAPSIAKRIAEPEKFETMPSAGPVKTDRLQTAALPAHIGPVVALDTSKVTLPPLDLPSAPAAVYGGFWSKQTYALLFLLVLCGLGLIIDQIRRRTKRQ